VHLLRKNRLALVIDPKLNPDVGRVEKMQRIDFCFDLCRSSGTFILQKRCSQHIARSYINFRSQNVRNVGALCMERACSQVEYG
jgi:hypothetical protein